MTTIRNFCCYSNVSIPRASQNFIAFVLIQRLRQPTYSVRAAEVLFPRLWQPLYSARAVDVLMQRLYGAGATDALFQRLHQPLYSVKVDD